MTRYDGKTLTHVPSIHDFKVSDIRLEGKNLIFIFNDIGHFDSLKAQNITADKLIMTLVINDFEFSSVTLQPQMAEGTHQVMTQVVSIEDIIGRLGDTFHLYTLDLLTGYQRIVLECHAGYDTIVFDLSVRALIFDWK